MLSFTTCGILLMSILPCACPGDAWIARASPTAVDKVEAASTYRFIVGPLWFEGLGIETARGNSVQDDERLQAGFVLGEFREYTGSQQLCHRPRWGAGVAAVSYSNCRTPSAMSACFAPAPNKARTRPSLSSRYMYPLWLTEYPPGAGLPLWWCARYCRATRSICFVVPLRPTNRGWK